MQPYFFPYLGYFTLIRHTDRWVVFDVAQYNRRSWMNRNRILHPRTGWQYITAPVRHAPHGTPLADVRLADPGAARRRLLGQLGHYRRVAPYFRAVTDLVERAFASAENDGLVELNIAALAVVCDYLGLSWHWQRCSQTAALPIRIFGAGLATPEPDLPLDDPATALRNPGPARVEHPGQWALRIAQAMGATSYLNPPGGRDLFRPDEWREAGISLCFSALPDMHYTCGPHPFEPHLSILDVLMWNAPDQVLAELDRQVPLEV